MLIRARQITAMNQKITFFNVDSSLTGAGVSGSSIRRFREKVVSSSMFRKIGVQKKEMGHVSDVIIHKG
jgi:hypothetical protein